MAKGSSTSTKKLTSCAATTNATSITTVPCDIYGIIATNTAAAVKFIKVYNKASAPTVGTDIPVLTICVPAGQIANIQFEQGFYLNIGLAFAITGADGDADATAVSAGDIKGLNFLYA